MNLSTIALQLQNIIAKLHLGLSARILQLLWHNVANADNANMANVDNLDITDTVAYPDNVANVANVNIVANLDNVAIILVKFKNCLSNGNC